MPRRARFSTPAKVHPVGLGLDLGLDVEGRCPSDVLLGAVGRGVSWVGQAVSVPARSNKEGCLNMVSGPSQGFLNDCRRPSHRLALLLLSRIVPISSFVVPSQPARLLSVN